MVKTQVSFLAGRSTGAGPHRCRVSEGTADANDHQPACPEVFRSRPLQGKRYPGWTLEHHGRWQGASTRSTGSLSDLPLPAEHPNGSRALLERQEASQQQPTTISRHPLPCNCCKFPEVIAFRLSLQELARGQAPFDPLKMTGPAGPAKGCQGSMEAAGKNRSAGRMGAGKRGAG